MHEEMNGKRLAAGEMDARLDAVQKVQLSRWYQRWRQAPWAYSLVKTLLQLPFLLVCLLLFKWRTLSIFFNDPVIFLKERGPVLLSGFLVIIIFHRFIWEQQAIKYYLHSLSDPGLTSPDADGTIAKKGRAAMDRIERKWHRWGNHKLILIISFALLLPLVFIAIFYPLLAVYNQDWSVAGFLAVFESGALVLVLFVFFLFGLFIGWSIWHEIRTHHELIKKLNPEV